MQDPKDRDPKDKDPENKEPAFKVQDRRRFSSEGEARAESEESPERVDVPPLNQSAAPPPKPEQVSRPSAQSSGASARHDPGHAAAAPAELTFAAFVWSLSEQALAALGEIPDPATGKVMHDLIMAQQMIDIIIMLRDKTRGNLDQHEQTLVQEILSTLQMKYVELARQPGR
jgi:hypothetical protein